MDVLVADIEDPSGFGGVALAITVFSFLNILLIFLQFLMHYKMLMRWHKENPLTDEKQVRSIRVGLKPDDDDDKAPPDGQFNKDKVSAGQTVPEADREKMKSPLRIMKRRSVPGIPVGVEESEGEVSDSIFTISVVAQDQRKCVTPL